jgi:hypothetical protein
MSSKFLKIVIHVVAWALFLSLPFLFLPKPHFNDANETTFNNFILIKFGVLNVLSIAFFYLNSYLFIPKLFFQKKFLWYAVIIVVMLLGFNLIIMSLPMPEMNFHRPPNFPNMQGMPMPNEMMKMKPPQHRIGFIDFYQSMLLFAVIWLLSTAIQITSEWLQSEKRSKEIEAERLNTELSLLKSQINPHFLFNTLNSIYSLALSKSDMTAEAVIKLSNLMRYVIDDAQHDKVPLHKELDYLRHFVELQKIRMGNNLEVKLEINENENHHFIAPLLLMPFVENAFKYGVSYHEKSMIEVYVSVNSNKLSLQVKNNVFKNKNETKETSGIGITNTKQRLQHLYNNSHQLKINQTATTFEVTLNLML